MKQINAVLLQEIFIDARNVGSDVVLECVAIRYHVGHDM